MGHRSGWWRVWDAVGWMGCGSRSRGTRAISSRIHNFSLHLKIKREVRRSPLILVFLELSQGDSVALPWQQAEGPLLGQHVHTLISGTRKYVTFHGHGDPVDVPL